MAQENLKKVIKIAIDLVEQSEKSFADGVQAKDVFDFIPAFLQAPGVDWKQLAPELASRTDESNAEFVETFKKEFDIQNKVTEEKVEKVIAAIAAIDNAYRVLKS